MAIVINGSGAVTGISVCGLSDGIVDAGTLATNSVDSAELVDGSIDNSHLADDAVDSDEIAAGAIDAAHLASGVGGALVKISEEIMSNTATVTFNSSDITSTYKTYLFVFDSVVPATDSAQILAQCSTDDGSSYVTSLMSRVVWAEQDDDSAITLTESDEGASEIAICLWGVGTNNGESMNGTAYMFGSQDTGVFTMFQVRNVHYGQHKQTTQEILTSGTQEYSVINNVKFYCSAGNFEDGTITLYGMT